jgi:hypothetical protein
MSSNFIYLDNDNKLINLSSVDLTADKLTVDDITIDSKIITMTGSPNHTATFTVGTNGTLSIVTTDTAAAANITITADGTAELAGTTVTLNSSGGITLDADGDTNISGTLALGDTTTLTTDKKLQFRDTGLYINSSANGRLDVVADTEIQIAATTIDINGNTDISGTLGASTIALDAITGTGIAVNTTKFTVAAETGDTDIAGTLTVNGSSGIILENDETITNSTNGTVSINGELAVGNGLAAGVFKSNGDYDVTLETGNSTSGKITIINGANGNINLTPDGTGSVKIDSSLNMNSKKITSVSDPTNTSDAATKNYVDNLVQGLSVKTSCDYATTGVISNLTYNNSAKTLTKSANGAINVDGVTLALNKMILVKNQTTALQNGIYKVTTAGATNATLILTRDSSMDEDSEFAKSFTFVTDGTTNSNTGWICTVDPNFTMGTNEVTFSQFSSAGHITPGTGLSKSGNTLNIDPSQPGITSVGMLGNVDINGGAIDGVTIGDNSAAAGNFTTLSASIGIAVNNNKFTVAADSGNTVVGGTLGIGINTPSAKLHILGDSTNANKPKGISETTETDPHTGLFLCSSGNVNGEKYGLQFGGKDDTLDRWGHSGIFGVMTNTNDDTQGDITFDFRATATTQDLTERMRITHSGNVGIGTHQPNSLLHVVGNTKIDGTLQISPTGYTTSGLPLSGQSKATPAVDVECALSTPYINIKRGGVSHGFIFYDWDEANPTLRICGEPDTNVSSAPSVRLNRQHIALQGYPDYYGYVGIGTQTPTEQLHVNGNVKINGTFSDGNYTFDTSGNVSDLGTVGCGAITSSDDLNVLGAKFIQLGLGRGDNTTAATTACGAFLGYEDDPNNSSNSTTKGRLRICTSYHTPLSLADTGPRHITIQDGDEYGNVGIGTTAPTHKLHVYDTAETVAIFEGGNVGIGTTNPLYPLHVTGYKVRSSLAQDWISYSSTGVIDDSPATTTTDNITVYSDGQMWAKGNIWVSSDSRIKTNIVDVPDNLALQQLRNIPCRYYEYIDKLERGNDKTIGFIAQEVKSVLPMAVSEQKQFIPNIYKIINSTWTSVEDTFIMSSTDLTNVNGVKYRFYVSNATDASDEKMVEITGNSDNTFTFDIQYTNVFCYGSEVNDFNILDKNKLFTLNFSATQEIDRIQQTHITKIASLETQVTTQEQTITMQEQKINELSSIIDKLKNASSFEDFKSQL